MWNDKPYFSGPEFDALLARTEAIAKRVPESWSLWYSRQGFNTILFTFDFPETPAVDPYEKYLSDHYVSMTATPGSVKCCSIAEANYFLDLVEQRLKWKKPKVHYEKVLKAALSIHRMAYNDQAYKYTDAGAESIPCRGVDIPYWMEQRGWKADADLILTVDWSNIYCHWGDIPTPDEEYAGSFLIGHEGESGGEAEVQLYDRRDEKEFKNIYGFALGSLEEFLLCQLLVWRGYSSGGQRTDDRSMCKPEFAYIRYDMVAGIWFRPTANNVQYFEKAIKTRVFNGYYSEYPSYSYDANFKRIDGPSERDLAVWDWLLAARKDAIELEDDDARNHIDYLRVEWLEPTVDEEARVAHDGWVEWLSAEAA